MCYSGNCRYERFDGECQKPRGTMCPNDIVVLCPLCMQDNVTLTEMYLSKSGAFECPECGAMLSPQAVYEWHTQTMQSMREALHEMEQEQKLLIDAGLV